MPVTLLDKTRLYDAMVLDERLSAFAVRLGWVLLFDFHNTTTGQCNPRRKVLAAKLRKHPSNISAALSELVASGHIARTRRQRGTDYSFPMLAKTRPQDGAEADSHARESSTMKPFHSRKNATAHARENVTSLREPEKQNQREGSPFPPRDPENELGDVEPSHGSTASEHIVVSVRLPLEGEIIVPTKPLAVTDADFDRFWAVYPRRVGKGQALRVWRAAVKRASAGKIIAGAERYAREVRDADPKYTKHPSTWLNGWCWDDEPQPQRRYLGKIRNALQDFVDGKDNLDDLLMREVYGDDNNGH